MKPASCGPTQKPALPQKVSRVGSSASSSTQHAPSYLPHWRPCPNLPLLPLPSHLLQTHPRLIPLPLDQTNNLAPSQALWRWSPLPCHLLPSSTCYLATSGCGVRWPSNTPGSLRYPLALDDYLTAKGYPITLKR
jgi:hypothetical protein